ncbi:MAG: preprotein translocase subunit SecG, partial [candidate division Zixibacteria bacterium]|nr:preprotein translocase subunit SecG [candidate division Zixibacteria bacterium]
MFVAWVVFHVLTCVALVLVVLMQSSKGEGLAGSAFGGSGSMGGAVFGGRGAASFLS